jgi:hypothetical protein
MENQTEKSETKLVSIFGNHKDKTKEASATDASPTDSKEEPSFLDAMKKNMANEERLRKERLKANQSVLKSYRIKN